MLREPTQSADATRSSCADADRAPAVGTPRAFGQLLRARREQLGLSLTQLASRVHFDRGHLSRIETGKRAPSVSFAEACDRALNVQGTFTTIARALAATANQQGWPEPAQLPAAPHHFVGRKRQLDSLEVLLHSAGRSLAVPVAVINGPPGVGKTALAVQAAHRAVKDGRFADGQLFVDLQGPGRRTAVAPADVLTGLLVALGLPAEQVPKEPQQRAATLRSVLHGREVLLVLDNAADAQQILPLLPGSPGCAVLVTSRSRLPGLISLVGAVTLALPELARTDAVSLLSSVMGDAHDADPRTVDVLAEQCGDLPLALVLAAEHMVSHPHRSVGSLVTELGRGPARLGLAAGQFELRQVFEASYRTLDGPTARMFRLLGLLPDDMVDVAAAATSAGLGQEEAVVLLRNLAGAHLIRPDDELRYRVPSLLRAYARELAQALD